MQRPCLPIWKELNRRKAMRILALLATDRFSGPGRQILQTAGLLKEHDVELVLGCTLMAGMAYPDFFYEADKRGVPLRILKQERPIDIHLAHQVRHIVRREKIDILQTHGYKPSAIAFSLKPVSKLPWLAFMHGHTAEDKKVGIYHKMDRLFVHFADKIVTVSDEMRYRLADEFPALRRKLVTVHNAVDPIDFAPKTDTSVVRASLGLTERDRIIGVIGRFSLEKGHRFFLSAFKSIHRGSHNVKAVLIGEGPEEASLREYCDVNRLTDHVLFAGYQRDIASFYRLFDLIVLPSLSEGLPNVVLEAFLHRIPVAAANVGGVPELVSDGHTGYLFPPADPGGMAKAITAALEAGGAREYIVDNASKLVETAFFPQAKVNRLLQIYAELLER